MRIIFRASEDFIAHVRQDLGRPHTFAAERVGFISVRAASAGEEDAQQQSGQAGGGALVQPVGQVEEGALQKGGQVRQCHGWLLDTWFSEQESSCSGSRPLSTRLRHSAMSSLTIFCVA